MDSEQNRDPAIREHDTSCPIDGAPLRDAVTDPSEAEFAQQLADYDELLSSGAVEIGPDAHAWIDDDSPLASELHEAKECLRLLEQIWPRTPSRSVDRSATPLPRCYSVDADATPLMWTNAEGEPTAAHFGRFQILRELGRGGGGIVYLASDPKLGRTVALKVPRPEFIFTPELQRRFLREARAAATLSHPQIVPVYETGQEGPICYIVSAFCPGTTLAAWLSHRQEPVDVRSAAELIALLADAVEYAHGMGVVHRDLKPSNVLLELREWMNTAQRSPTVPAESVANQTLSGYLPRLTDFGLAKLLEREGDETRSGAVMGTPMYMAPEQAEGQVHEVGPATDVYALGVMLYELLAGRPPFQGDSDLQTLHQVVGDPPAPLRVHRRRVPRDLEAICLKCLEKPATSRYRCAADLAEDLRRFLAGVPTNAKPAHCLNRALKWTKRRPATALSAAVSLLLALFVVAEAAWHVSNIRRAEETAASIEQSASESRYQIRRHAYATDLQGAYQAWRNSDLTSARALLANYIPSDGARDERDFEWYYLRKLADGGLMTLVGHKSRIRGADFRLDGEVLATCAEDGWIRLWDSESGQLIGELSGGGISAFSVRFAPDGRRLASAHADGQVRLWDVETGELLMTLGGHSGPVFDLAFSADGTSLATAGSDQLVRVWDIQSGHHRMTLHGHTQDVYCVAFGPDGQRLISGGADHTVRVWDLRTPDDPIRTIQDQSPIYAVAISPDGQTLAAAGSLQLWDLSGKRQPILLAGHQNNVRSLEFSADGTTLVSVGEDMSLRTWDAETGAARRVYLGHAGPLYTVSLSSRKNLVATAGADQVVKLWDPFLPQECRPLSLRPDFGCRVAFSPGVGTLAAGVCEEENTEPRIWVLADGKLSDVLRPPAGMDPPFFSSLAFSPDGTKLAAACFPGPVLLWGTESSADVQILSDPSGHPTRCVFSPDGSLLAVAGIRSTNLRLLEVSTGKELITLPGQRCTAFSPDGRLIAAESIGTPYAVELWDWATRRSVAVLPGHDGEIYQVVFSKDGRLLATGSQDGTARLWDLASKSPRSIFRGHTDALYDLAFCPRGRSLATVGDDGTLKFWDIETGRILLSLSLENRSIKSLTFSTDGQFLATASALSGSRAVVDLWEAPFAAQEIFRGE